MFWSIYFITPINNSYNIGRRPAICLQGEIICFFRIAFAILSFSASWSYVCDDVSFRHFFVSSFLLRLLIYCSLFDCISLCISSSMSTHPYNFYSYTCDFSKRTYRRQDAEYFEIEVFKNIFQESSSNIKSFNWHHVTTTPIESTVLL